MQWKEGMEGVDIKEGGGCWRGRRQVLCRKDAVAGEVGGRCEKGRGQVLEKEDRRWGGRSRC
jgi:hypothetical protein